LTKKKVLSIAVIAAMLLSSLFVVFGSFSQNSNLSGRETAVANAGSPSLSNTTYDNVTFTGNSSRDFPAGALLYTNFATPWGSSNNITNLYGTWNKTTLFLSVSGIKIGSGNNFMLAISNNSAYGTENISSTNVSNFNRDILFSQPMDFFFFVSSSSLTTLYAYKVVSTPSSAVTDFINLTKSQFYAYNNVTANGDLEVALNFSAVFNPFPKGATVSAYASIFGGSGGYVGPTIPSGQSYDVTYETPELTSHDVGAYVMENTFYKLFLDPLELGQPESGIIPNFMTGLTFHTVAFTGNPSVNFVSGEKALMNTNVMYGPGNLLNSSYITWNETTLFLGFNLSISGNHFYLFLSNDTGSGYGAYNISTVSSPYSSIARNYLFTKPINFIFELYYTSPSVYSGASFFRVTSSLSQSNITVTLQNMTASVSYMSTPKGLEIAIPFMVLYNFSASWPYFKPYTNISMVSGVAGNSNNNPSMGPTLPAGQGYAYTGYYNKNHTVGNYDLLNTFFTELLDPYGDGQPAPQINPTYTSGFTFHNVVFTGNLTNDFVPGELIGTNSLEPYGTADTISSLYLTWNYTTLFVGAADQVAAGPFGNNYLMIALSNNTIKGSTNLSKTNVPDLQRNFIFSDYIDYIYEYTSGAANGSLYEVIPSQTNSTQTNFTFIRNFTQYSSGSEFSINFSQFYTSRPASGGQDAIPVGANISLVALIYGGPGAYIGPTIPTNQSFSSSTAYAPISQFITKSLDPNLDGYAEPGIMPSFTPTSFSGAPIRLNIIFNDHQPLYAPVGYGYWLLPWTAVHLEEYAEQALIIHMYPSVNITYSLSGSLLFQIEAIANGFYNNSYLKAAFIPVSQWNNTLYTEISTYNDTFLSSFAPPYQWNTTSVRDILEFDLAFNTPLWVYSAGTPASGLYKSLFAMEQAGKVLNNSYLTDALVEFFLWSISYPIISGMLGTQYMNKTLYSLYNQTSFSIGDIVTIMHYYPVEANITISAFKSDMLLNSTLAGNVELLTTPFDHPILPLLLLDNWTGAGGNEIMKGIWSNDTLAQLNIGKQIFYDAFGQNPVGLWSPEQAVSGAIVPFLNQTGYEWTSSADSTLAETGISTPSSIGPTAQQMENLYQPYTVVQNGTSVTMVFRDSILSNDWGFNFGNLAATQGNWAPVGALMNYLKNVYSTVPRADHSNITVTIALDGENWMFMNPFPLDAVPFLKDLYLGLQQNSSWLTTVTMQQYLAGPHRALPVITNLPIGSWNPQPTGSGISEYLGQWAGHAPQDATWQQLALVRSIVQNYGLQHGLVQPMNLTALETSLTYPVYDSWNLSTAQQRYDRAWTDIYGAEGSDIYFAFDPADQSLTAQNAIVFEYILRYDLTNALTVLGLPLTPFLKANWTSPLVPTIYGTNSSVTPPLSGSLYTSALFNGKTAYSVNNNFAWKGAYQYKANGPTGSSGINTVYYAFDANNLYFAISVNGPTSVYGAPNSYTQAPLAIQLYLSGIDPGQGNLAGLSIPNAVFASASGQPLGFAAKFMVTIEGTSVTPSGSGSITIYNSGSSGNWIYNTSLPNAYVGSVIEIEVPLSNLGMIPGNSITFAVATVNQTTGAGQLSGPLEISIPSSLAKLSLISVMHNTAPSNGPGNYTYPLLTQDYPPNSVQMRWVNISLNQFLVQFNFTFGNLTNPFGGSYGFSQPIIDIYIHESNGTAGSTAMLPGPNANVTSTFAWQWAIQADGFPANAYIQSYTGQTYDTSLLITSNLTTKTVSVEAPLSLIGTDITHYGYVIVAGIQDGYGTNGWDPVLATASDYQGGGSGGPNAPNIYSYIAPNVVNSSSPITQQSALSSYTSTSLAALPGIYLPITVPVKTISTTEVPTYSATGYDSLNSEYMSFYDVNNSIWWSSSTDGKIWSSPAILLKSSAAINSLSYYSLDGVAYLLVGTATTLTIVNLTSGITITNVTSISGVLSSSITELNGQYFIFAAQSSDVTVMNSNGASMGTLNISATNISAYSNGKSIYLAYSRGGAIYLSNITISSGKVSISGSAQTIVSASTGATIGQMSLSVNSFGQFVISYVSSNSSGSNILVSYGVAGNVTTIAVTSDGLDFSPSTIISENGYNTSIMVSFTNSANSGNVYFIPVPVATFTYTQHVTTVVKPKPSAPSSLAYLLIGSAVVLLLVVVVAYVIISRRKR
jgi:alpha-amylase/alpha-mannosidase (GH57 family)